MLWLKHVYNNDNKYISLSDIKCGNIEIVLESDFQQLTLLVTQNTRQLS